MHEKHRASLESTRKREQWTNTIENQTTEKLQQRKGAKKRREESLDVSSQARDQ